jgi:hypothetical protein
MQKINEVVARLVFLSLCAELSYWTYETILYTWVLDTPFIGLWAVLIAVGVSFGGGFMVPPGYRVKLYLFGFAIPAISFGPGLLFLPRLDFNGLSARSGFYLGFHPGPLEYTGED